MYVVIVPVDPNTGKKIPNVYGPYESIREAIQDVEQLNPYNVQIVEVSKMISD